MMECFLHEHSTIGSEESCAIMQLNAYDYVTY